MTGKSILKALVAEQMQVTISTDVIHRFRSRCIKLCLALGAEDRRTATKWVDAAFLGRWENVQDKPGEALRRVIPPFLKKNSTYYDMKSSPFCYLGVTLSLCRELGPELCKFSFCPTRSGCIPSHIKFDTEALAQILLPKRMCGEARKRFGFEERNEYNDWVWNRSLNRRKVNSKTGSSPFIMK